MANHFFPCQLDEQVCDVQMEHIEFCQLGWSSASYFNPKAFASRPSRETKVHSHGITYSPNYSRSADLPSSLVSPLVSWLSIPSSCLFLKSLLLCPMRHLVRIHLALAAALFSTFLPQPYLSPSSTPLHQVDGNPYHCPCPGLRFHCVPRGLRFIETTNWRAVARGHKDLAMGNYFLDKVSSLQGEKRSGDWLYNKVNLALLNCEVKTS